MNPPKAIHWTLTRGRKDRLKLAIYHALHLVEAIIYLGTLSALDSNLAAKWIFSDYLED